MYIQRLSGSTVSFWKFLIIPIGFALLLLYNFWTTLNSPIDPAIAMQQLIDSLGATTTLAILLSPLALGFWLVLLYGRLVLRMPVLYQFTGRYQFDWSRVGFSFLVWSLVIVLSVGLEYLVQPGNFSVQFNWTKFWPFLLVAVTMIPMQIAFEELLFRGHLTQSIAHKTKSRALALLIPSLLFGLMHIGNPEVSKLGYGLLVYYIGSGLFFGVMTLVDDGMELALGTHAANNLVGAILVSADWTAFNVPSLLRDVSEPSFGFDALVPLLLIYPLVLFVFSKRYGWNNILHKTLGSTDSDVL